MNKNRRQDERDYKTRAFSESDAGRGLPVAATTSPGTLVHTALSSTAANEVDALWVSATNSSGAPVKLTLEWGGTTAPDDHIEVTIPAESGLVEVIAGYVLHDGRALRAFATVADVVVLHGFVRRYDQT